MWASANILVACACVWLGQTEGEPSGAVATGGDPVTVKLLGGCAPSDAPPPARFAARITRDDLIDLVNEKRLSVQFEFERHRQATVNALRNISMLAVIEKLDPYLAERFADRFNAERDLIYVPVSRDKQVTIDTPDLDPPTHVGPQREVIGFILPDVTEDEFVAAAVRVIQTARQLMDTGDAGLDRSTDDYYRGLAEHEVAQRRSVAAKAATAAAYQTTVRTRIAEALGLQREPSGSYTGDANWLKESRRFSYIVKEGKFIRRLEPLVQQINSDMALAGFSAPSSLDRPGIYYDDEIGDVEIVLPKPMLIDFLGKADSFERRMAEDALISIEAVRLTDRDLMSGALASRLSGQLQGVHNVDRGFSSRSVVRELGINALLAVANRQLQVKTLNSIASGGLPAGIMPIQIASPTLPAINLTRSATNVGSNFAVGADPIFFDGSQQVYGFSYLGPDGRNHSLTLDVIDNLRETWERIERNLIVHKIKKTDTLTPFSVPVGPDSKTYNGIAALISQENQQLIVATGTGAISEISATAGTWLIIEGFDITPIPGSSTTLTEEELRHIETKVLLTMFLRDPTVEADFKRMLLETRTEQECCNGVLQRLVSWRSRPIRPGRGARTYATVFDERYAVTLEDRRYGKREENSVITLTFYSSQGNIIQSPGSTQLGDANDLTSFTTELRPNVVTPISSFFTKSGMNTKGESPLTGLDKGEQKQESKSMTHLVIRARFPTIARERKDRDEGRFLGYFELPINREPATTVDLPFLSSSEHPAERLAKLRVGLMFPVLDPRRVRKPFAAFNPQEFPGDIPREAWETATTRLLLIRKLISDSPGADAALASDFKARFIVEVRSLLEYDPDFFDAPTSALRNMTQWNDPDRVALALNNSPGRFALQRLVGMLDELGERLVPDDVVENNLAVSPTSGWADRSIYPLSAQQVRGLRRDVAAHYLRFRESYGDAFLEAVSMILELGTYRATTRRDLMRGPFRGYLDLVIFDNSGNRYADPKLYETAHSQFLFLKSGGFRGKLFERSMVSLEHLDNDPRRLIYRGTDVLTLAERVRQLSSY